MRMQITSYITRMREETQSIGENPMMVTHSVWLQLAIKRCHCQVICMIIVSAPVQKSGFWFFLDLVRPLDQEKKSFGKGDLDLDLGLTIIRLKAQFYLYHVVNNIILFSLSTYHFTCLSDSRICKVSTTWKKNGRQKLISIKDNRLF